MGINFGGPYSDKIYLKKLSKYNVIVSSFYPEWNNDADRMKDSLDYLKKNNSDLIIMNYAIFNDVSKGTDVKMNADILTKVDAEDWWLKNAAGDIVQQVENSWNYWAINITEWAKKDNEGLNFPQWRAKRDNEIFFSKYPQFDGWYVDITNYKPTVPLADYKRNGVDVANTDEIIKASYRNTQVTGWENFRDLQPSKLVMGNIDHAIDETTPEFVNKLNGAFMESLVGFDWSLMNAGWNTTMTRYNDTMDNLLPPKLLGFGFRGTANNYQTMRFGLTTCLMNDGYYSYSNIYTGYTEALWFDEYDVKLGYAVDKPQTKSWKKGIYRRNFDNGMALVNPTNDYVTITIEAGYKHIKGKQDPIINNGQPATSITISPKDGVIMIKE